MSIQAEDQKKAPFIVAVDGTAGSGKSSICSTACGRKSWAYINTGSLYRAVAYLVEQQHIDPHDESKLCDFMTKESIYLRWNFEKEAIFFREKNLKPYLYSEKIGQVASSIAKHPNLRKVLLPIQKELIKDCSSHVLIVEGRDIGSVVIPDAPLKIFMSASIEERAKRRLKQLEEEVSHENLPSINDLVEDIRKRDQQDSKRKTSPLIKSEDAVDFDTSDKNFEECVADLIILVEKNIK